MYHSIPPRKFHKVAMYAGPMINETTGVLQEVERPRMRYVFVDELLLTI